MRPLTGAVLMLALAGLPVSLRSADKLTYDERVELMRGLSFEYATVKEFLPRSKKPLAYESTGAYDKKKWEDMGKEMGPAARQGDLIQLTKVSLEDDKIVIEINGGLKSGKHWYDRVQIGMGQQTSPISNGEIRPTTGTNIEILFHKPLANLKSANVKKILAPIDFSELSMDAMRAAMELAKDVGAEVHLVHIVAPHHVFIPLPLATNAEQSRELAREAAMLEQAEEELGWWD